MATEGNRHAPGRVTSVGFPTARARVSRGGALAGGSARPEARVAGRAC